MRAIVVRKLGGPEGLDLVPDHPALSARPGHAIVALEAAALNFPDILTLQGTYQHKQEPPYIPGMEGAGRVVSVGEGVAAQLIGRAVMVSARGTFAEQVAVSAGELTRIPEGWTWGQAAAFPIIAKTAYHALVHRARLQAGEWLVVHGAAGGTGHMAVKLGKALGGRVIATARDAPRRALLADLGADITIDSGADDLAEQLKAASGGRGVDVVFDPVGGAVFEASLKAAAFGARIMAIGFTAGAPNAVRTNYALIKGLSILGVRAGEAARKDPRIATDYAIALPRLAAAHDLRPHIGETFPLDQAALAFDRLAARAVVGKIVLDIHGRAGQRVD